MEHSYWYRIKLLLKDKGNALRPARLGRKLATSLSAGE
ncbi:hypothetical protein WCP94_002847 [Bilophila wadsworthia]